VGSEETRRNTRGGEINDGGDRQERDAEGLVRAGEEEGEGRIGRAG